MAVKCEDCGSRIHHQDRCVCGECVDKIKNPEPAKKVNKKKVTKKV